MPFRRIARAAPFVLGAVAVVIWLRRRRQERATPPAPAPSDTPPAPARSPAPPREPLAGRAERAPERRPVDIVTVVDDLLGASS